MQITPFPEPHVWYWDIPFLMFLIVYGYMQCLKMK